MSLETVQRYVVVPKAVYSGTRGTEFPFMSEKPRRAAPKLYW